MGMILTRASLGKEGLELGFVNEVVPQAELMATAERWAETICKNSPMSIRAFQAGDPEGPRSLAGTGDRRAARIPRGEAMAAPDYIEDEGVFGEAPAEVGGEIISHRHCEEQSDEAIHLPLCGRDGLARFARKMTLRVGCFPTYSPAPFYTTRNFG